MKKSNFYKLIIVAIAFCYSINAKAQTDQKELQEVAKVVSYYLDGGTNGDSLTFSSKSNHTIPTDWTGASL